MSRDVVVNLAPLNGFVQRIQDGLRTPGGKGKIRRMFKLWAARYRADMQDRFDRFSKGGGDWAPLKHKRKRGAKNRASILRDTGILFSVLNPTFRGQPGAVEDGIPFGVEVGFGGPRTYPSGKGPTVADIAFWHHTGAGRLPKRTILVEPSRQVVAGMVKDAEKTLESMK